MIKIYELFDNFDGNDDILSDIGNVGQEVRHGMWGWMPYSVSDGEGVQNEGFISFVMNRDKYPKRKLPSKPYTQLVEQFNECVFNLKECSKNVSDKKKLFENLLILQEYLHACGGLDDDKLIFSEEYETPQEFPPVEPMTMDDQAESDIMARAFAEKMSLGAPAYLGGGSAGHAYRVNNNRVLKFTTDPSEANAGLKIMRAEPQTLANVYGVYKVYNTETQKSFFVLIEEDIVNKPVEQFNRYINIINDLSDSPDNDFVGLLKQMKKNFDYNTLAEKAKFVLSAKPEANVRQEDRQAAYNFFIGLLNIKNELVGLGIDRLNDYSNAENLGYRGDTLVHFDAGGRYKEEQPPFQKQDIILLPEEQKKYDRLSFVFERILNVDLKKTINEKEIRNNKDKLKVEAYFKKNPEDKKFFTKLLNEDGSSKFSTDNELGQDGFPPYNQDNTEPSIENDLDANSAMYSEDLEYNHVVGDANDDEFSIGNEITERKKSYMPGAQAVTVKKKCRLAGLGNTSAACNQGDISNLELTKIEEIIQQELKKKFPRNLYEEIKASEAYEDENALQTLFDKKRGVALIAFGLMRSGAFLKQEATNAGLNFIRVEQDSHPSTIDMNIVYRDGYEKQANRLHEIMKSHGGYVQDQSPEEAREIGRLLEYTPESIEDYVRRKYQTIPVVPEKSPDDYSDLDETAGELDKYYVRTGILDNHDRDIIMSITGGDNFTKLIADMYLYFSNKYTPSGGAAIEPRELNSNDIQYLKDTHERLKSYNQNVFPLHDLYAKEKFTHPLGIMNDLRTRELLIEKIRNFPSILLRNLKEDIRKERNEYELKELFETLRQIEASLALVNKTKPEQKEKILKKIFSSKFTTFDEVLKRLQDTTIPYLSEESEIEDVIDKIEDMGEDAEIIYNKDNILAVVIKSAEAMRYIGCSSQWCFATGGDDYWTQYTRDGEYPTIVFNFNVHPSERTRMVVVLSWGEVYDMYNEYMEEGAAYLEEIGVYDAIPMDGTMVSEGFSKLYETEQGTYYRALDEFKGNEIEFQPEGYYEAVDDEGNPVVKHDVYWRSDVGEVAASKTVGGAVMGLYSMHLSHGGESNIFFIYQINDKPDVDISHWTSGDFSYLQEVRFRKPVKGKYVGKINLTNDLKKRLQAYYEMVSLDAYDEPDEETAEIFQDTNYDTLIGNMKGQVNEISSLEELPFKVAIEKMGGKIYSVGGAVRDKFLGKESKDLDILITGIPMDKLEKILSYYGQVNAVGKSFGILKFKPQGGEEIDIAIPRTERPSGEGGHKGFDVTSDHSLPIEKDLERRDFTINAIAQSIGGELIDPYGGQADLKDKIIRVVNPEAFSDDPLRMLRAVQFAARFGFNIEDETRKMIKANAARIKEIPPERILTEFDKIVHKGNAFEGAYLLKDLGLRGQIFGNEGALLMSKDWDNVQSMGEFVWLLSHNIVDDPAAFFKDSLKGDIDNYKEIKAIDYAYENESNNLIKNRMVAHNVYSISPKTLNSQILPESMKNAAQELLAGKFPKGIGELAVNGNDLMSLGLQGKQIGDALKSMLMQIYSGKVQNNKEELLSLLSNR